MTTLLYHLTSLGETQISPFDASILKASKQSFVKITSPYIGIRYLKRIIDSSFGWSLISDIEAWLSSLSYRDRESAWSFIKENLEKIHHYPGIHAKTVIGSKLAYIGSANLTSTGILSRTEMGVLLETDGQIRELNSWFDEIWNQTTSPSIDETNDFLSWLNENSLNDFEKRKSVSIKSIGLKIHARLADGDSNSLEPDTDKEKFLDVKKSGLELYQSVENLVNSLALNGFKFGEFINSLSSDGVKFNVKDVYLELLTYCANSPRSIFAKSTVNRLIYLNGQFKQSSAIKLQKQLQPFDGFLSALIHALSFDEPRRLPDSYELSQLTGLRPAHQLHMIHELVEIGLIAREMTKGDKTESVFTLAEDFEWNSRFILFSKAHSRWNERILVLSTNRVGSLPNVNFPKFEPIFDDEKSLVNIDVSQLPLKLKNDSDNIKPKELNKKLQKQNKENSDKDPSKLASSNILVEVPPESSSRNFSRVPNSPKNNFGIDDTLENRVDKIYLNLAQKLEQTKDGFRFKNFTIFASYLCAYHPEDIDFVENILRDQNTQIASLFNIEINVNGDRNFIVRLNSNANTHNYPKTYKFIKDCAFTGYGFFSQAIGYTEIFNATPERKLQRSRKEYTERKHLELVINAMYDIKNQIGIGSKIPNTNSICKRISTITSLKKLDVQKVLDTSDGDFQYRKIFRKSK